MNITSTVFGFDNELAEEVRQFEDLTLAAVYHETEEIDGVRWHAVTITMGERKAIFRCGGAKTALNATDQKRMDKHAAKRACYQALCALSGKTQPWGSLTGVRPTALLRSLINKGREKEFIEIYGVHPRKYELAKAIIGVQEAMMKGVDKNAVCVYVGIPFCVSRCSYCSFPGRIAKPGEMEAYVAALLLEMDAAAQVIRMKKVPVTSVYIGGGTPTSLPVALLEKILNRIRRHFGEACEITLEAGRPDTIDKDKLSAARTNGVSRICINPQTMVNTTLQRIGRNHTANDVEQALDLARGMGFSHINMDVIAGLPGETAEDFSYTLSCIRKMAPSALTCHTLSIKRGSELALQEYTLCATETVSAMVEKARTCAGSMGMHPYYMYRQKYMAGNLENVGYAQAGKECLYNVAMMDDMLPVMGLGVGAMSKVIIGDLIVRKTNPRDVFVYLERLENVLEQKRCFYGVDKGNAAVYNMQNGNEEDR